MHRLWRRWLRYGFRAHPGKGTAAGGGDESGTEARHNEAMNWTTDRELEITGLSEPLRKIAGTPDHYRRLHLSDVWKQDGAYGFMVSAHRWALEGETVAFETPANGTTYRVQLEPLRDARGTVVGVRGEAAPSL